MKTFLIALIVILPILLTLATLRRVYAASRRYAEAESKLIDALRKEGKRSDLNRFEGVVESFLTDQVADPVQLAGAIRFIGEEAERLDQKSPIVKILRHGSDYSKARYLGMLFSEIPPPPPPPFGNDHPNQPPPSFTERKAADHARRNIGSAQSRPRAVG